ncbi:FHA domain-containing protein, partial [Nostoc punctiforme]|uniref:FHA domain-containing protein n=1 Tax=Nostoc punctiforme TaxID=272131 RepID=UPI003CC84640
MGWAGDPVPSIDEKDFCKRSINDPLVSRQHAQISRKGDRYQITDFGSTDGTRVNKILPKPNIPH